MCVAKDTYNGWKEFGEDDVYELGSHNYSYWFYEACKEQLWRNQEERENQAEAESNSPSRRKPLSLWELC